MGDQRKPTLDLIEPGAIGWGEVQMKARPACGITPASSVDEESQPRRAGSNVSVRGFAGAATICVVHRELMIMLGPHPVTLRDATLISSRRSEPQVARA